MGQRGPLPQLKVRAAERLADLTPPLWLSSEAAAFYSAHAKTLVANDLLTSQTAHSFSLTADLWGRVRAMSDQPTSRAYLDAVKSFQSFAKLFRLVPCDKPGVQPEGRHEDRPAFKLEE